MFIWPLGTLCAFLFLRSWAGAGQEPGGRQLADGRARPAQGISCELQSVSWIVGPWAYLKGFSVGMR